jgi:small subunit ribosomal protein S6e
MGNEFPGDILGQKFAGYVFKITGGNDKDGFCMRQGILKNGRVRILMDKNQKCFRPRRDGQRKRKSVRGCIVGKDICVLALTIIKHGEQPIESTITSINLKLDITTVKRARSLGPKRASSIRKLYKLEKTDDVRKFVVRKTTKSGKKKAPKIQRLVSYDRIRRKKVIRKIFVERLAATKKAVTDYKKLMSDYRSKKKQEVAHVKEVKKEESAKKPETKAAQDK